MRRIIALLIVMGAVLAWRPAVAGSVVISPSLDLGAVPSSAGTGLSVSYYGSFSSEPQSWSAAAAAIASSGGPTATFTTNAICYPDCAGGTSNDSSTTMTQYVGSNASNFAYTVPPSQIPTSITSTAMVITGYIAITRAGTYTFNLASDDGSLLSIGGQSIINNDGRHGLQTSTGQATFSAPGLYAITLDYFEASGSAGLELYASDPTGACVIGRGANCAAGTAQTGLFYSSVPVATPEPASLTIFGAGLAGIGWLSRRRTRRVTNR